MRHLVTHLAMHRQRQPGTNPAIHLRQLVTAGMATDMDVMVLHRQQTYAARR